MCITNELNEGQSWMNGGEESENTGALCLFRTTFNFHSSVLILVHITHVTERQIFIAPSATAQRCHTSLTFSRFFISFRCIGCCARDLLKLKYNLSASERARHTKSSICKWKMLKVVGRNGIAEWLGGMNEDVRVRSLNLNAWKY